MGLFSDSQKRLNRGFARAAARHSRAGRARHQEIGMAEAEQSFEITLEQVSDYEFRVRFDDTPVPDLITDESSPLGGDAGPTPSRLMAVAVANCMAASLLFALRKYKNSPAKMGAKAKLTMTRNEHNRLRITHIGVDLQLADKAEALEHLDRVLAQFEDFCIVTQSVRQGIKVDVSVHDGEGKSLPIPGEG
jgi:uncharacterized OsmC-like protein